MWCIGLWEIITVTITYTVKCIIHRSCDVLDRKILKQTNILCGDNVLGMVKILSKICSVSKGDQWAFLRKSM